MDFKSISWTLDGSHILFTMYNLDHRALIDRLSLLFSSKVTSDKIVLYVRRVDLFGERVCASLFIDDDGSAWLEFESPDFEREALKRLKASSEFKEA